LKRLKNIILLSLFLIIFLFFLEEVSEGATVKIKVIVQNANIRLKPDTNSPVITTAPIGTILDSEGKEGKWYKVNLPPDRNGFVVSGYIHESIVEVSQEIIEVPKKESLREEEKKVEVKPPIVQEPPVKEEKAEPVRTRARSRREAPQKAFSPKFGLGLAFPTGDLSDLFSLGLGANFCGSYLISSQPQFNLIGGIEGFYFLRKSGYTDVSMSRLLVYGDCRFSQKINSFGFFAEGGAGLYLDILDIETWWWYATSSEFNIGARVGGGITFGKFEIMAMYHIVKRNMFSIMFSYTY
jgi:hypothetical protein